MKVLVIGGYGTFGGRLVRLLADRPRSTLLVAGRSGAKAQSYCSRHAAAANLVPLAFDRDGDVIGQLRDAAPDMVVDASGPFQVYGDDPYAVVKACIALKIDYIDLADSSAFVDGIAAFDEAARSDIPAVAEPARDALETLRSGKRMPLPPEASAFLTHFTRATPAPGD